MNAPTLTMPKEEAKARLKQYRSSRHHAADEEYQRIAMAYEQLAEGTPLLVLSEAFKFAPIDSKGRPRLAIARADKRRVHLSNWQRRQILTFDTEERRQWNQHAVINRVVSVPFATDKDLNGYALTPIIPPDAREKAKGEKPQDVFVFWEVEKWADEPIQVLPDKDPMLLRRLDDDLYAVLAEWDLTEVERAILAGRTTRR